MFKCSHPPLVYFDETSLFLAVSATSVLLWLLLATASASAQLVASVVQVQVSVLFAVVSHAGAAAVTTVEPAKTRTTHLKKSLLTVLEKSMLFNFYQRSSYLLKKCVSKNNHLGQKFKTLQEYPVRCVV